jgi:hypothetical protein
MGEELFCQVLSARLLVLQYAAAGCAEPELDKHTLTGMFKVIGAVKKYKAAMTMF